MNLVAFACLLLLSRRRRGAGGAAQRAPGLGLALASQAAAAAFVLAAAPLQVIRSGVAIQATWAWSYPIDALHTRLDPWARSSSRGRSR